MTAGVLNRQNRQNRKTGDRPSWHYDKPACDPLIEELPSGDLSGLGQQRKRFGPSFFGARFDSSWTLRDRQTGDGGKDGGEHEGQTPSATMAKLLAKRKKHTLGASK
ncbi:MAG: hypothetical protein JNK80_04030, partial [Dechloromonas sp.]|nr:hypothetical protein [Dechloromonas sp.]